MTTMQTSLQNSSSPEGVPITSSSAALPPALVDEVAPLEKHGFLFGQKLTNSWSPFLHDVIYSHLGLNWGQVRLDSADMDLFLKLIQHPNFYGASVTMPNKVAIVPHLHILTQECRDVGACNTLFTRPHPSDPSRRLLCGANTDVLGIKNSFIYNVPHPEQVYHNKPALVIGGGGAARSAVYALRKFLQVTDIYLVNREASEVEAVIRDCKARGYGQGLIHVSTEAQARELPNPGAIVACVPDFPPTTPEEILARSITTIFLSKDASAKGAMLEMCYNPTPFTELGKLSEGMGWQVILGTEALIWQGLEQDRYWTGRELSELPVEDVKAAIADKVAARMAKL